MARKPKNEEDTSLHQEGQSANGAEDNEEKNRERFHKMYGYYPEHEQPHQKFHRLATGRVSRVIDGIRTLPALANKTQYEYADEHPEKMFAAIEQELATAKSEFQRIQSVGASRARSFTL